MSNPSGVDANAAAIDSDSFSTDMAGYGVEFTCTVTITNPTSSNVSVNLYLVLDGTMIDALPLIYPPGIYRQHFHSDAVNLTAGNHTAVLYSGASTSNVQNTWAKVRHEVTKS